MENPKTLVLIDVPNIILGIREGRYGEHVNWHDFVQSLGRFTSPRMIIACSLGARSRNHDNVWRTVNQELKDAGITVMVSERSDQKGDVDTLIGLQAGILLKTHSFTDLVIVSGDGDMYDIIKTARTEFKLKTTVIGLSYNLAPILRRGADQVQILDELEVWYE